MAHANAFSSLRQIRTQLDQAPELPFAHWLPAEQIEAALAEAGGAFRNRVFTPVVTVWLFLSQVLSPDQSCKNTVARLISWLAGLGRRSCSPDPSSYCQARQRLPVSAIRSLTRQTSQMKSEPGWLWKGRQVKMVDGSSVTMSDTAANQKAFPQSRQQAVGLGFPIARLVVVFSLAWATVLDFCVAAMRGQHTGETSLFRQLWHVFEAGDIALADSAFESYRDIAGLKQRQVDVVMRKNGSRQCDFRRGHWLGIGDHIVVWSKPRFNAQRFSREEYDQLPEQISVREVRYRVETPGFRTDTVVVVTTLCDAATYPADEIADLYAQRWHCELDLNALKTTMQMNHLHCQSPEMVEKAVAMHLLAYNLLRKIMAEAARKAQVLPRTLSFKGAMQLVNAFAPQLAQANADIAHLCQALLDAIAQHRVGGRPGRVEPRKRKRRHARYSCLTRPRALERQRLAA